MNEETGNNREISNRQKEVDLRSRKANKKNIIFVIAVLIALLLLTGAMFWYIFMGKPDHEKAAKSLKDRNYTEAQYEFQKAGTYNKNFSIAGLKIG